VSNDLGSILQDDIGKKTFVASEQMTFNQWRWQVHSKTFQINQKLNHPALKVQGFEPGLKVPLQTKSKPASTVILANAGIQNPRPLLDSRIRGNDKI